MLSLPWHAKDPAHPSSASQIQQYIVEPSKKDAAAFGRLSKPVSSPFLEGFLTNHGYAR